MMQKFTLSIKGMEEHELGEAAQFFENKNFIVKTRTYHERSVELEEVVKYVFSDFNLVALARDGIIWALFVKGLSALWKWSKQKKAGSKISGWIIDIQQNYSLNVILPDSEDDLQGLLNNLPEFLEEKTGEMENHIVWVSLDEKEKLTMKIIGDREVINDDG